MVHSKSKAKKCLGPRIYGNLNGLREQFELLSKASLTKGSGRPFDIYLEDLEREFELMFLKIESLQKERDKMVEAQTKNAHRNMICERCSDGTMSPQPKTLKTSFFRPFFQSKSPSASHTSRGVRLSQERATRPSTQHTTVDKFHSANTPTLPSHTTFRSSGIVTHSPTKTSVSTVDPDPGPKKRTLSITYNEVKKELHVEILHVLCHRKPIFCVRFSQDGKYLAAGCEDGKAYIYGVETGTLTCFLKKSLAEERYRMNSFGRDDKYSTLGSSEGFIKDRINSVCFSRDGKCLATGSSDGGIYVWEISTKFVRNAFKRDSGSIHSLDLSPNGRFLVSAYDNSIRLWNMRDGAGKFLTEDDPTFIDDPCYSSTVFCPDGRYVAASHRDGVVRVWDVRTGQLMRRVKAHMCRAYGVVFMPDREGLLSAGKDMTLKYWDIGTLYISRSRGSSQTTNSVDGCVSAVEEQTRSKRKFSGHKDPVRSLAISPDGKWVASGSYDHSIRIWDTRTATTQCTLDNVHKIVGTVDFSPAGHYLASAGYDGMVRIWRYSYTGTTIGGS